MLKALRRTANARSVARRLCAALMAQARAPAFFDGLGAPDTLDGRFDLAVLHAWLVLERLESEPALSQALVDEIFTQFDEALRHLGTGDAGMNRRLKTLASMFYGRLHAYRGADDLDGLAGAIHRNVYRGAEGRRDAARALATYALAARSYLASADLVQGPLDFRAVPIM